VEQRDAEDDRGTGDEVVAVGHHLLEQADVLGIARDVPGPRVGVVGLLDAPVLREDVEKGRRAGAAIEGSTVGSLRRRVL
jgi:hypothetical protein